MFVDYYKFMGIHPGSNEIMIKDAYTKKSQNLNLDTTNKDDKEELLKTLEEVYGILMNAGERVKYDQLWLNRHASKMNFISTDLKPSINYLRTSKKEFELNDEITISWKTTNCDQIILNPFGSVSSEGSYTFKIEKIEDFYISIKLIGENTVDGTKVTSSINLNKASSLFTANDEIYGERYQKYLERKEQNIPINKPKEGSI